MIKFKDRDKFVAWFMGFCDAEANFQTTTINRKNGTFGLKYSFHLGLQLLDKALVEYIHENLENKGHVYNYEIKKESHLAITKKDDLKWLLNNIFNTYPLLTKHQATRLLKLKLGIENNIKNIQSLSESPYTISYVVTDFKDCSSIFLDYWIVGFLNGEVSFSFRQKDVNKFIPIVNLEHTDERVVKMIKDRLNLNPEVTVRLRENRKPIYSLYLSSRKDLKYLVEFLDENKSLKGYKLYQYESWKAKFHDFFKK